MPGYLRAHFGADVTTGSSFCPCSAAARTSASVFANVVVPREGWTSPQKKLARTDSTPELDMRPNSWSTRVGLAPRRSPSKIVPKKPRGTLRFAASAEGAAAASGTASRHTAISKRRVIL